MSRMESTDASVMSTVRPDSVWLHGNDATADAADAGSADAHAEGTAKL